MLGATRLRTRECGNGLAGGSGGGLGAELLLGFVTGQAFADEAVEAGVAMGDLGVDPGKALMALRFLHVVTLLALRFSSALSASRIVMKIGFRQRTVWIKCSMCRHVICACQPCNMTYCHT